jgi:hypothetical protein
MSRGSPNLAGTAQLCRDTFPRPVGLFVHVALERAGSSYRDRESTSAVSLEVPSSGVGTIDVAIPKLRQGTYFPEWLLERRKRAESALITVVADCYLAGVSTRRMDKLVKTLGIHSLSKSQVSRMAADLDEHVEQFRHRPLGDAGPFTFVAADALTIGMGLERALMLRKGIPDIRYLRAEDPRIASQMLTLDPWQHVSPLPATRRDISVVLDAAQDEETLGDRIRTALGDEADVIESVEMLGRTAHEDLPDAARARLGTQEGQVNLLLRIVLRPIDRTLTSDQANGIRNAIYRAVHEGPVMELV